MAKPNFNNIILGDTEVYSPKAKSTWETAEHISVP